MQLSDLLGLVVTDAGHHRVGTVIDVRLTVAGSATENPPAPRLAGLVVSPHTRSSFLGYERTGINAPAVIAAIARWRHRGTFVVEWADIARIGVDRVILRGGFERHSPGLRPRE
ncbi:PRC-barrel domain-containing protein [Mycolicibacterium smegmatis]|uniref:PRC-barrel domain-containing protein n=3 Tax=Mycolicibacterium smegmatis TaxID=1772 RepID=I7FYS9_MYCS2|nr:hypothetical protein [Mycolicibacterium smegmatis]ABK69694.1 conserved hypothetical protein [Mycolicibacterium smegmatis MC2 155]AFP38207.1 hypothetical protein MSMEI_1735 [Mycolicibacterium smegmatis MC2 155]AIU07001.1 hypothetical protein LJ00_08870 [Mycolicibacterium smegmatis MC2 155]AIU13626.1 hypothetical protein LI99_08870 [Mycolicibacterium smegmatis]AIU20250.1 hypothetical protein LI98_08870 [Mycolicibacterium smegmatis]